MMGNLLQFNLLSAGVSHNVWYHLLIILIAGLAAFTPRYFPILFFSKRKIREWFNEWMTYVPVCLFTALVVKNIFTDSATYRFLGMARMDQIIAAIIVMVVAYVTRSMALSVVVGLVAVTVANLLLV